MPKRVIDGDALWVSEKLLAVPAEFRAEYAWVLPMAQANGCFECSPMLVWRTCYSALRENWTIKMVGDMLDAFENAKMLFRWQDKAGKTFGFFPGSQKEGRLPSESVRLKSGRQWQVGMVPGRELAKFLGVSLKNCSRDYQGLLQSSSRVAPEESWSDSRMGNGIGNGSGVGTGEGVGSGVGVGLGCGVGAHKHQTETETTSNLTKLSQNTEKDSDRKEPVTTPEVDTPARSRLLEELDQKAAALADLWGKVIPFNPNADKGKIGGTRTKLWTEDFRELLTYYPLESIKEMLAFSQSSGQAKYYVRTKTLVDKASFLYDRVDELKKKKAFHIIQKEFQNKLDGGKPGLEEEDDEEMA